MYQIGRSAAVHDISEKLFENYQKSGIEMMEIGISEREECDALDYKMIKENAKKYGIRLWSYHLPFAPFGEIDISQKSLAKDTVEYLSELIKKAADIGIDKYVLHPSAEPIEESDRADRIACAQDSLVKLAAVAKAAGGTIAVEDLPRTCLGRNSDEILELISADQSLGVCFDTNHLLTENPADFVKKVGHKIITIHVSDYDNINERHWLPGEGIIDWNALITELKNCGYNGPWMYEISFKCPWSIERARDLTCDDFVRNANEVLNNKPITIFSTPKPGIGMWK